MKTILSTLVMALGCLLPAGFAKDVSIAVRQATARIIPMSELERVGKSYTELPKSRTGVMLSNDERFVYTVQAPDEKLSDSVTPYLVLFPVVKDNTGAVEVKAFKAIFVNKTESKDFITLTIPARTELPDAIAIDKLETGSDLRTGDEVQMVSFSDDQLKYQVEKDKDYIWKLNDMLLQLKSSVEQKGYTKLDNSSHLFSALMSYMNPYVQMSAISSNNQQIADSNRCTIPNLRIDSTTHGAPVLRNDVMVALIDKGGSPLVSKAIVGNAYVKNIPLKYAEVVVGPGPEPGPGIKGGPGTQGGPGKTGENGENGETGETGGPQPPESPVVKYVLYTAGGLLVLLVIIVVIYKLIGGGDNPPPPPPPVMTLRGEDGRIVKVSKGMVRSNAVIGRSSSATIKLDASCVSGRHAHLCAVDKRVAIQDDGSTNGTFVNGERLQPGKPKSLHPGDVIKLGTYELRVL